MKKQLVFIIFSILFCSVSAQISTKQVPRSFKLESENIKFDLGNTLRLSMPDIDEFLYRENLSLQKNLFKPRSCAILIAVNESFFDRAKKISLQDADIYILKIETQGALALNFYSDDFYIPKGCELYLYNSDRTKILGAYTYDNNNDDGLFATDYVYGSELIMELYQPKSVQEKAKLQIERIGYFYRDIINFEQEKLLAEEFFEEKEVGVKGYQDAESCEVNVNCSEGNNFRDSQRSVVRLLIPVSYYEAAWCTGTLMNNTNNDRTPYILSAAHCIEDMKNFSYLSQIEFYFNYEYSSCSNSTKEPSYSTLVGCELLTYDKKFGEGDSDYMLMKLKNSIPKSFNAYWAGWSMNSIDVEGCVGIHHPYGDVKKISTVEGATQEIGYDVNYWDHDTHVMVRWKKTAHGHGVTEGGSSGSALFNPNGQLIGTLSGGESSCQVSDYNKVDWYGRFDVTYNKIHQWLDPQYYHYTYFAGKDYEVGENDIVLNNMDMEVLPNPASEYIHIKLYNNDNEGVVAVLDRFGRTVYSKQVFANDRELVIDINDLNSEIYFIRFYSNKNTIVKKIIVKR